MSKPLMRKKKSNEFIQSRSMQAKSESNSFAELYTVMGIFIAVKLLGRFIGMYILKSGP